MYYPSLQDAITANQRLLGANFENLGKSQRIYLSYSYYRGWSVEDWRGCLGFLKSIFRCLGIAYASTRLRRISEIQFHQAAVHPALIEKIRRCCHRKGIYFTSPIVQQRIEAQQQTRINSSLQSELQEWGISLPLDFLTKDQKGLLVPFLQKLRQSTDYGVTEKDGTIPKTRLNLKTRLGNILSSLGSNLVCRNAVFDLLETNRTQPTCGDGIMLLFHDVEIEWQWHQKGPTHQERANLAVRIQRYQGLLSYVKQAIIDNQWKHYDQAEIYLYYIIKLRKGLDLPISTQTMEHYRLLPPISQAMLNRAQQRGGSLLPIELLARSERWRTYLQELDARYAKEFNEIDDRFGEQMDNLYSGRKEMPDGVYNAMCSKIRADRERALGRWTWGVTQGLGIY